MSNEEWSSAPDGRGPHDVRYRDVLVEDIDVGVKDGRLVVVMDIFDDLGFDDVEEVYETAGDASFPLVFVDMTLDEEESEVEWRPIY